jgi:hypothetical protein
MRVQPQSQEDVRRTGGSRGRRGVDLYSGVLLVVRVYLLRSLSQICHVSARFASYQDVQYSADASGIHSLPLELHPTQGSHIPFDDDVLLASAISSGHTVTVQSHKGSPINKLTDSRRFDQTCGVCIWRGHDKIITSVETLESVLALFGALLVSETKRERVF